MIWIDYESYSITVPQGDTGLFTVNIFDPYVDEDTDSAIFIVYRKNQIDDEPLIRKELPIIDGAVTILLSSDDTFNIPVGEYDWDVILKRDLKSYPVYDEVEDLEPDYKFDVEFKPIEYTERHSLLSSINGLPTFRVLEVNE